MSIDGRLDPWFRSPLGDALLCAESEVACRLLERVFGFVAVAIGGWWPTEPFMTHCAIRRRLHLDARSGDLLSPLDNLALASDSVDAIVLPHTLEFVESPQRLLREVERVLVGEGHVLILGFNPWSAWTVRKLLKGEHFPESGQPLARARLIDWLELLGFEILAAPGFFRRPPLDHRGALERLQGLEQPRWLPLPAGAYAVLARKHVYSVTPLRPAWERRRRLIAGLASPTAQSTEWRRRVHYQKH
ncbi:MAG TPA: methyltransferase domain-containing protein [Gammaproteobacteria bacterium]|nr:methyltransferase domain-containing protein [Gammaproteobacteria bacterium]